MTGMKHTIEQVRQAMQDAMNTYGPFSGTDQARHVYDYLHALGLLAPAPLHMVRTSAAISATGALALGYPTHEFVKYQTDWLPADGIDRSEGGKAATSD